MRDKLLVGQFIAIAQVLAAATVLRLAIFAEFHLHPLSLGGVRIELAFHVAAQVEVATMGDPFQFAEFALGQERKRVLDVGRPDAVVGEFFGDDVHA